MARLHTNQADARSVIEDVVRPIGSNIGNPEVTFQKIDEHNAEESDNKTIVMNDGWPWSAEGCLEKLVTQAPFALNENNIGKKFFKLPTVTQTSPILSIPSGIDHPLLNVIFKYHSSAANLAGTCQAAFHMVCAFVDHWDVSRRDFNLCNEDPKTRGDYAIPAYVGNVVIVSQFRIENPVNTFEHSILALQELTLSFHHFADRFEILHLHRIPLLTTQVLALTVPHMRKLKVLGIYRCELIHVGDTMKLLEIIGTNRIKNGRNNNAALDFYPRFHIGPRHTVDNQFSGSYGVTWDNSSLDTRLAVWQLLTRVIPEAKKQGVDLTSSGTAFRKWLDQGPCRKVGETIRAIEKGIPNKDVAILVDCAISRSWPRRATFKPIESNWSFQMHTCGSCNEQVLGIFFDGDEYQSRAIFGFTFISCLGCKLTQYLDTEEDHHKFVKRHIVFGWLRKIKTGGIEEGFIEDDINSAVREDIMERGLRVAKAYDKQMAKLMARGGVDIQVQKPWARNIRYSPQIDAQESLDPQW